MGVNIAIDDSEALALLGTLLEGRDKALREAAECSAQADQLLEKSIILEKLCERVGKAFVERRMAAAKNTPPSPPSRASATTRQGVFIPPAIKIPQR